MYKFLKAVPLALALAFGAGAAQADTFAITANPYANTRTLPGIGLFEDFYTLSVTEPTNGTGSVTALNLSFLNIQVFGIDNATLSFFSGTPLTPGALIAGPQNFSGATPSQAVTFSNIGMGDYYFRIAGQTTGLNGGMYQFGTFTSTASTTPVPEPGSYAMLLAGLGMLGLIARRRRNA